MLIILMGYMASGKSTIGKQLSKMRNTFFYDLDDLIEKEEGLTIPEIFKTKGEIYFRKTEHKVLSHLTATLNQGVLALGGGTPSYANNMELIKNAENANSVYLKASVINLTKRLFNEKESRPLISHITNEADLLKFISKHIFDRAPFYNQADFTIDTDNKAVDLVVKEIEQLFILK